MQFSTKVRWKSFATAVALFGITLLQSGSTWQIASPPSGSTRTKTSDVGGGGMTNGTVAVFRFGNFSGGTWIGENDVAVTATMNFWSGTIPAPSPNGWIVETDKEAWIEWDDGMGVQRASTNSHTVTN